jgi:hypothetical protein
MVVILPSGKRYESVGDWAEAELGVPKEQITPEWNIKYYTKLLQYTKKTVKRKKLKQELKWWLEVKECRDKAKQLRQE